MKNIFQKAPRRLFKVTFEHDHHGILSIAIEHCPTGKKTSISSTGLPKSITIIEPDNERCQPPWNEKELRHKLQSADNLHSRKPRGYLL